MGVVEEPVKLRINLRDLPRDPTLSTMPKELRIVAFAFFRYGRIPKRDGPASVPESGRISSKDVPRLALRIECLLGRWWDNNVPLLRSGVFSPAHRGGKSHHGNIGVRRHDLPSFVKFLEVHDTVSLQRLLGRWERDRPPSQGECEIRF